MQNSVVVVRRYIDILMFVVLSFIAGTGFLIAYRLVPCSRGGDDGNTLLDLGRHDWGSLHLWAAYTMLALLIVHLILNFSFIKNVVAAKSIPALVSIAVVGAAIVSWFALVPIDRREGGKRCGATECPSSGDSFTCPNRESYNASSK